VFPVHNFCAFGNQKSDFQNRKKKNRKVDLQKKSFTGKDLFFFILWEVLFRIPNYIIFVYWISLVIMVHIFVHFGTQK
jgi:hypothetical protein